MKLDMNSDEKDGLLMALEWLMLAKYLTELGYNFPETLLPTEYCEIDEEIRELGEMVVKMIYPDSLESDEASDENAELKGYTIYDTDIWITETTIRHPEIMKFLETYESQDDLPKSFTSMVEGLARIDRGGTTESMSFVPLNMDGILILSTVFRFYNFKFFKKYFEIIEYCEMRNKAAA